jgi:hypothetical protein
MLYLKTFYRTFLVPDPCGFCERSSSLADACLSLARKEIVGRNFDGCHVIEVVSVDQTSPLRYISSNLSVSASVDVRMTLKVEQFVRGSIITGLSVVKTDPSVFFQHAEKRINGGFARKGLSKIIQKGNSVAIRVVDCSYAPNKTYVAIAGDLLTCDVDFVVYKISKGLSRTELNRLWAMLGGYRKELELRDQIVEAGSKQGNAVKDAMWFFESIYYSYKTALRDRTSEVKSVDQLRWRGPQGETLKEPTVDLLAYLRGDGRDEQDYYWARPLELFRSSPLVVRVKALPKSWESRVVEQPALVAFSNMIMSMDSMAFAIRNLAEEFSTHAKIMSQKNIWRALQNQQLSAGVRTGAVERTLTLDEAIARARAKEEREQEAPEAADEAAGEAASEVVAEVAEAVAEAPVVKPRARARTRKTKTN